jgi:hypothetical protein
VGAFTVTVEARVVTVPRPSQQGKRLDPPPWPRGVHTTRSLRLRPHSRRHHLHINRREAIIESHLYAVWPGERKLPRKLSAFLDVVTETMRDDRFS